MVNESISTTEQGFPSNTTENYSYGDSISVAYLNNSNFNNNSDADNTFYFSTTEYFDYSYYYYSTVELEQFGKAVNAALFYIILAECIFGVIGNIIALVVWTTGKKSRCVPCSTYFKFLAGCDIVALVLRFIFELTMGIYLDREFRAKLKSDISCKMLIFGYHFTQELSTWIVVCLSVERAVTLLFPFKFFSKGHATRAKIAFLICLVSLSGLNIQYFLLVFHNTLSDRCEYLPFTLALYTLDKMCEISAIYLMLVVPFVIIIACNITVTVKMCMLRKTGVSSNRRDVVSKLTKLSLCVGILQCICILPSLIDNVNKFYFLDEDLSFKRSAPYGYIIITILLPYATLYLNSSINFLLYSFTVRDFRSDFKQIFSCY